jgi:hypothetical protein
MISKNCGNRLKLIKEIQHPLQHFTLIDKPRFTKILYKSDSPKNDIKIVQI